MNIAQAIWADAAHTFIDVTTAEGGSYGVPDTQHDRDRFGITAWEAEGNVIADYVDPPKYPDAAAAKAAMVEWIAGFTAAVTGPVPVDERLSWDAKEAAGRAYIAETATAAQTAMIEDEAAITEEVPADLAAIIIAKADTFRAVVARVAGLRRKTIAAIDAVADPADFENVLLAAKAEAEAMAASLGITAPG